MSGNVPGEMYRVKKFAFPRRMHYVSPHHGTYDHARRGTMSETFPDARDNHHAAGRRPTMREVAAVAGVSLSTVSRALNDDPKVAPDLAEKVRAR